MKRIVLELCIFVPLAMTDLLLALLVLAALQTALISQFNREQSRVKYREQRSSRNACSRLSFKLK